MENIATMSVNSSWDLTVTEFRFNTFCVYRLLPQYNWFSLFHACKKLKRPCAAWIVRETTPQPAKRPAPYYRWQYLLSVIVAHALILMTLNSRGHIIFHCKIWHNQHRPKFEQSWLERWSIQLWVIPSGWVTRMI